MRANHLHSFTGILVSVALGGCAHGHDERARPVAPPAASPAPRQTLTAVDRPPAAPDPVHLTCNVVEQLARERSLEGGTLTVHSATLPSGSGPAELQARRDPAKVLVKIDIELTNYGYPIDPDDFVLETRRDPMTIEAHDETMVLEKIETIGKNPYTERLTHAGKPIAWKDPSIVNDPDLRILAYFQVPRAVQGKWLTISYNHKGSIPFMLR